MKLSLLCEVISFTSSNLAVRHVCPYHHFLYRAMNYHLFIYPAALQKTSIRSKGAVNCTSSGNASTINVLFTANLFLIFKLHLFVANGGAHALVCAWRSEYSLQKPIISFHYVGSRDQTQVIRLGSRHLHPETSYRPLQCNIERDMT